MSHPSTRTLRPGAAARRTRRRTRLAALALAVSALSASGATLLAAPASAATAGVVEQMVTIQDHQNHHSLASSDGEGSRIVARGFQDASTSFWMSNKPGDRVDFARSVNGTERVLEMDTRDGRSTQFVHWWAGANQQWTLETAAEGGTYLRNAENNGCLTYHGVDREVTVEGCDGSMSQRFDLNGAGTSPGPVTPDQQRFLDRVNALRAQYGKAPVRLNSTLSQVAKCNADQMDQRRVSGHFCNSSGIASGLGYTWRGFGEVAFYGPTTVDAAVDGWINSPKHLGIMIGDFNEVGLARTGAASWNADFGTR
ncbi:CAP domain-containing protein [Streptomyces rubellomurinus]|uniref:CAP domain-containing protein n=1 Tax=Streptomyces rubellomurinus (strain ATCC 31215) TaxID=359131 RepID=UPI00069741B7|nr:CAP domain-containing protein [Streptomyces rubellomurinus]